MFPQSYPVYANCFDRLTTNGIIADDLVGYVTGEPSPYLHNYVAQRGGTPNLPGQILPDQLPNATPKTPPVTDVYQTQVYEKPDIYEPAKKDQTKTWKKFATGALLIALGTLAVFKGKSLIQFLKSKFTKTTP